MKTLEQNRSTLGVSRRNDRTTLRSAPSQQVLVQPKLELTSPGDSYEREADSMADFVMRKAQSHTLAEKPSTTSVFPPIISRRAGSNGGIAVGASTESGIHASLGGGQPLPSALRSRMESAFGADFSGVRLHTGYSAESMNNDLNANAFTFGNDIFFNRGQYQPHSTVGQHLIAHELTHVLQQSGKVGREGNKYLTIGCPPAVEEKKDVADFISNILLFKDIINTATAFKEIYSFQKIVTVTDIYIYKLIGLMEQYNFYYFMAEALSEAKLLQAGQGGHRAIANSTKSLNVAAWIFSVTMDIKRVIDNKNSNDIEFAYYCIRALATLADCPFAPWPPHVKILLATFNAASGLGDLYLNMDNAIIHPQQRIKMVGDFYGGPDSFGGVVGALVASVPIVADVGELIGKGAAVAYINIKDFFED